MYLASSYVLLVLLGSVCTVQALVACEEDAYTCQDTLHCISKSWLCDGEKDCVHGDDESPDLCARNSTCTEDQFSCDNSTCIPKNNVCDGNNDCLDNSDEKNCTTHKCEDEFIACNDGQCIHSIWQCDGDVDCMDGSDEQECGPKVCDINQFTCTDTQCIDVRWVCDGEIDCPGGSDEDNCSSSSNKPDICDQTEWQCEIFGGCIIKSWLCDGDQDCVDGTDEGEHCNYTCSEHMFFCNGDCISKTLLCDGNTDCSDGSDERDCAETSCFTQTCPDNSHCEQVQHSNNSIEIKCVCNEVLQWDVAAGYCKTIDVCQLRETCSQICVNVDDSYRCECYTGYTIENNTFCRATGQPVMLYYAGQFDIRKLRTDTLTTEILVEELRSSVSLDFDYEESLIFWTDVSLDKIMRAREDKETGMVTDIIDVVERNGDDEFTSNGVAVDWLYKNIYWTDTGSNKIKVSNYDGSKSKTLIDSGLDEPRAISVDPENGYMYWSDWGNDPKIERSGMDGIGREIIVYGEEYLTWPNGLTIDYVGKRIYWIDAKLKKIGTANLDGSNKALMDVNGIQHPFSISVFEDSLYWTDWFTKSIKTANKITGKDVKTLLTGANAVMDIKVYHELRQDKKFKDKAIKLCEAAQCEYLCLPTARHYDTATVTCVCGDEKKLNSDNRTCSLSQEVITTPLESNTSSFTATIPASMPSKQVTKRMSTWPALNTSLFTETTFPTTSSKPITRVSSTWHAYTSTITETSLTKSSKPITSRKSSTWRESNNVTDATNIPRTMSSKTATRESPPTTSPSPIVTSEIIDTIQPRTSPPCQNQTAKETGSSLYELQQSKLEKTRLAQRRIKLAIKILKEKQEYLRAIFKERLANERLVLEAKIALINHKVKNQKKKLGTGET